jgi:hypothetical protein
MICDCYGVQSFAATRLDKLGGVRCSIDFGTGTFPSPIAVPWCVNLKIATVKMCSSIH